MNAHNGRVGSGGDCSCSALQRYLGLADGDQTLIRVVDGELRVRPRHDVLMRIQAMLRPFAPAN